MTARGPVEEFVLHAVEDCPELGVRAGDSVVIAPSNGSWPLTLTRRLDNPQAFARALAAGVFSESTGWTRGGGVPRALELYPVAGLRLVR